MYLRFLQDGGSVDQGAQANPMDQILQAAAQAVQQNDGDLALQVCNALLQIAQGGAQQQGEVPEEGAPEEGEPVYGRGGRLLGRARRRFR